jgi:AcrR family transcriptional regulator
LDSQTENGPRSRGQAKGRKSKGGSPQRPVGRPRTRPLLTSEAIVDAAIAIADAEGFEAVSIRRLAAALDARPMSLYDHFASKADLFAAMVNEVSSESLVPEPFPIHWREALTAIARQNYAMLVRHPWVPTATGKGTRFGPKAAEVAGQALRAMASLGLETEKVWVVVGTMNDYVVGHAVRAVSFAAAEGIKQPISATDPDASPELKSLAQTFLPRYSIEGLEAGLKYFLDGVEREQGSRPDP